MEKKKFIILLLCSVSAVFLAAFLSFYLVFGNMTKNYHLNYIDQSFEEHNNIVKEMEKNFGSLTILDLNNISNNYIANNNAKIEELKDSYKITIALKPYNNDPKNVNFKIKNNNVTISTKYKSEEKNNYSSSSFYQSFNLADKLDSKKTTKIVNKHNLIITIPKIIEN